MAESMTGLKRTHRCAELSEANIGEKVTIMGWVQKNRNKGGLVFVDVRDRSGLIQVVFEEGSTDKALLEKAAKLRSEFVVAIVGTVEKRSGAVNENLATGAIEIKPEELRILSESETPPFPIEENSKTKEEVRLKYRFLDLRRPDIQRNLMMRSRVATLARQFMAKEGFLEIETPFLIKSTPEGARDYLVPSRIHPGSFYALPQSPQIFKQLLMCSGYDRYFQIVKCFRDEDLRADRQPEFTQVDIETSFLTQQEIRDIMENMIRDVFKETINVDLPDPYPVMSWHEAMTRFGSDKPDLRIKGIELREITEQAKTSEFKVFRSATELPDGKVVAMNVPHAASMPRSEIDSYTEFVKIYGAKGLAYIKVNEKEKGREGLQSPIVKNLSDELLAHILEVTGAQNGDVIFFGADRAKIVYDSLGALRLKIGHSEFGKANGLYEEGWKALWVVDFPMFEYDDEEHRWVACHHPFTMPHPDHVDMLSTDPGKCLAQAYDMVLNGWEIGGGSIRIHRADIQSKVFAALNIGPEEARAKFGFLLDNLQYGAPPHGGIAFGLDRIVTIMAGAPSIRDVIAFPKTQRAQCLLTNAPAPVDEKQLRELHIRLRNPQPAKD